MRRAIGLSVILLAVAPAAVASPARLHLQPVVATWYGADGELFVRTAWTPAARATDVTVDVARGGRALVHVRERGWLLGHRTFLLHLAGRVKAGDALQVHVTARSGASRADAAARVAIP